MSAVMALAACGGGGGGGGGGGSPGGGVTTPPPAPIVPPVVAPPPGLTLTGPSVGYALANGVVTAGGPVGSGAVSMTILDTEVANATALGDIAFNENEKVTLDVTSSQGNFSKLFPVTTQPGDASGLALTLEHRVVGASPRDVGRLSWITGQGTSNYHSFQILRLQEGVSPLVGNRNTGDTTELVALIQYYKSSPDNLRGFAALGNLTSAADMPRSGTAQFVGEAYGEASSRGPVAYSTSFVGRFQLSVDFAATTGAVTGVADNFLYSNGSADHLKSMTFTANLSNGAFSSSDLRIVGQAGPDQTGSVQGAFYGSGSVAATEVGGVFSASNADSGIVGGFVGGRR